MIRALFIDEEAITGPARPEDRDLVVAIDPVTHVAEIRLDEAPAAAADGALGPIVSLGEPREPPSPCAPFRAVVVPRGLSGIGDRPPIVSGVRAPSRLAARPRGLLEVILTDFPVRVTAAGAQSLELAQEVIDADELTLELRVLALTAAAGGPDVTVEIQTGMQLESSVGWVSAGAFARVTAAPSAEVKTFGSLLRYVRWSVSGLTGTSATFFVSGVARRWSRAEAV